MILIALLLAVARRGQLMTRRVCVGLHGIPFTVYRFRCGTDGVSRLLARFKLDGLPQILNVVRGEMALIGPEPERVEFSHVLNELIPFYRQKQTVKPGLIGWSQLHCDADASADALTRLEYDLYYIKHISLVLDAYIAIRALKWILTEESNRESALPHDMPLAPQPSVPRDTGSRAVG
jgi:lipopolysaccharide/colanic/teichoic acid biosynthesis glycosyltransferase